ncbi:hypothetical protein BH09MYX1_BH09MYX1_39800 [soil metagenome]
MRRVFAFLLVALALVSVTFPSRLAFADPSPADKAKAEQLKVAADDQMDNLHYSDALRGYQDAYALNPDPKLLYNMGRAKAALGDYPGAVSDLEKFRSDASPDLRAKVPQLADIITEFRKHVTVLTITCNVNGARVLVNSKLVGTTPFSAPLTLNAGPADIEVGLDTYTTEKRKVTLPEGGALTVDFKLLTSDLSGVLLVRSTPNADASKIDDKAFGGTPLEVTLPPGQHRIKLFKDGYDDINMSTVLGRGERKELSVAFEKSPSITSRPAFWALLITGIVLVAGGITAAVLALTIERSPDPGSIPPGIIKGP